jgi:hypothetical protein
MILSGLSRQGAARIREPAKGRYVGHVHGVQDILEGDSRADAVYEAQTRSSARGCDLRLTSAG